MSRSSKRKQHTRGRTPAPALPGEVKPPGLTGGRSPWLGLGPRSDLVILLGILLAGLTVRGLYLRQIVGAPDFAHPAIDALTHDYWARGLATGNWSPPENFPDPHIPDMPFFRPPGYPYFLALIYWLFGGSYLAPRIVQMLLGTVNAAAAFLIGRRWFGRAAGLTAAAGMALYWALVYFEGELHAPAPLVCLLLWSVYLLGLWAERGRLRYALAAGALLGLAGLLRPNVLLLVPAAAIWGAWIAFRGREAPKGNKPPLGEPHRWRRAGLMSAGLVLPAAAVIAPATVHNYVVGKEFVPISTNAGINLYIGNNEWANGRCLGEIPSVGPFGTCFDYPGIVKTLERRLSRPLKHSEISAWLSDQAMRWIRAHPDEFLSLTGKKFLLFWGPLEVGHNKEIHFERKFSPVLRNLPGNFTAVLAVGLVGFAMLAVERVRDGRSTQRWRMTVLIVLAILVLSFSILPFFVAGRYRVPVVPFLLLLGGYALSRIGGLALERRAVPAAGWAAACVAAYLLLAHLPQDYEPELAKWHYDRGTRYIASQQYPLALEEFRTAARLKPDYAAAWYNIGFLLARKGKRPEAMDNWREALRHDPGNAMAHSNLGMALLNAGQVDEALRHLSTAVGLSPESALARSNLGLALIKKGRLEEAAEQFTLVMKWQPASASPHFWLGQIRYFQGRPRQAIDHYRQALRLQPDDLGAMNDLAWLLATQPDASLRDGAEAVRLARRACQGTQDSSAAWLDTLAAAQAETGDFKQAVQTLSKALELARQAGPQELLEPMQQRLELYQRGLPFREVRPPTPAPSARTPQPAPPTTWPSSAPTARSAR